MKYHPVAALIEAVQLWWAAVDWTEVRISLGWGLLGCALYLMFSVAILAPLLEGTLLKLVPFAVAISGTTGFLFITWKR